MARTTAAENRARVVGTAAPEAKKRAHRHARVHRHRHARVRTRKNIAGLVCMRFGPGLSLCSFSLSIATAKDSPLPKAAPEASSDQNGTR
eukprot:1128494-Pleurochrysis_carterae.AAC.1